MDGLACVFIQQSMGEFVAQIWAVSVAEQGTDFESQVLAKDLSCLGHAKQRARSAEQADGSP